MRSLCIFALALAPLTFALAQTPANAPVHADAQAEWQKAGIEAVEAAQWIAAGIPFAQWARQWKGERFTPAEARAWVKTVNVYTARNFRDQGFTAAQALQWIEHGVGGSLRATEFRDRGFSPADAGEWWRLKFFPEDAAEWRQAGFSAVDALAWRYGEKAYRSRPLYSADWAAQWRNSGFTLDEARRAAVYDVNIADAIGWKAAGFGFDEGMQWRDAGFTAAAAAREQKLGRSAVDAEERASGNPATTADVIRSFRSDIVLRSDATVDVTETIEFVNRPGGAIERCFARVFPSSGGLRRRDASAVRAWPTYRITALLHNGVPATHTTDHDADGNVSVCVGPEARALELGAHTIVIAFTTDDRLIAHEDHDQFSFGLKDSSMKVPVYQATATIRLPRGANTVSTDGFAGPTGRKYFSATVDETPGGDVITYRALRPLTADMAFDAIVSLPKDVARPGLLQRVRRFDRAEGRILSSLAFFAGGLAAAFVYFVLAWHRVGRDPTQGPIVQVYQPPVDVSPALMRHLVGPRRVDGKSVVATLIRLAQSGSIHIREQDGRYRLAKRAADPRGCSAHEEEFLQRLFDGANELNVGTADARRRLRAARGALAKALRIERATYIVANRRYLWPGVVLSMAGIVLAVAVADPVRGDAGPWHVLFMLAVAIGMTLLFWPLLKAPTPAARRLFDEIHGFKRFLDVSYREGIAAHLAYAVAFDVDYERVSILDPEIDWYTGSSGGFSPRDLMASLRTLMPRRVDA